MLAPLDERRSFLHARIREITATGSTFEVELMAANEI